jgi:hypothetical protein
MMMIKGKEKEEKAMKERKNNSKTMKGKKKRRQ